MYEKTKESQQLYRKLQAGRQTAPTMCDHLKLRDAEGAVLDIGDLLNLELKDDNLRVFDTVGRDNSQ